jgi:hypothetical protein
MKEEVSRMIVPVSKDTRLTREKAADGEKELVERNCRGAGQVSLTEALHKVSGEKVKLLHEFLFVKGQGERDGSRVESCCLSAHAHKQVYRVVVELGEACCIAVFHYCFEEIVSQILENHHSFTGIMEIHRRYGQCEIREEALYVEEGIFLALSRIGLDHDNGRCVIRVEDPIIHTGGSVTGQPD